MQSTLQWQAHPCFSITKFSTVFQEVSECTFLTRAKVQSWSRLYTMNHPTTHTVRNSIIPCCSTHRLAILYSFQCSFHAIIRPSLALFRPALASTEQDSGCQFGPLPLGGDGPPFAGHGHTQTATFSNKRCKKQNSINASLAAKPVSPTL